MDTQKTTKNTPEEKSETKCKCCLPGCKPCLPAGRSKTFKIITAIVGLFLIALVCFAGGVKIGIHKAKYSCDWGKNYERNFMGERSGENSSFRSGMLGMMKDFSGRDFRNAHGLAGTIISIADNNIVVKDKDGKENTVAVTDKTIIKSGRNDVKLGDLKQDDQIVVMGSPDENGAVNAVLIRVFNNATNN